MGKMFFLNERGSPTKYNPLSRMTVTILVFLPNNMQVGGKQVFFHEILLVQRIRVIAKN